MSRQPLRDNAPSAIGSTDEVAALRKRVEELERSITDHHVAHVMRRQPGDVCPVCSPVVPLPQKYGDEIPKSLDLADLCQAAVARAEKAERERDEMWFDLCEYQKHEAQLCPEGEGFVSYVPKLQDDLDAALLCLGYAADAEWLSSDDFEYADIRDSWQRVAPLLAQRKEAKP